MSLFSDPTTTRALVAAVFTGLAAPAIGTYLVQRRMSLMGDGMGHIAIVGVGLGLLTNQSPVWFAALVTVIGAVLIEVVRSRGRTSGDVALALVFYGGLAGGVLIAGLAGTSAEVLEGYLFGSITTVTAADVWAVVVLSLVVVVLAVGLAPQLFTVCQDEEFARVTGIRVDAYNVLVSVMAAVTVTVAMHTVGLLLVSALMVVPVATSQQLSRSFAATLAAAMVLGAAASVGGVVTGHYSGIDIGPTIVLLALAVFVAAWPVGVLVRRRRRLRAPFEPVPAGLPHEEVTDHGHQHGPDCGHLAVPHGDHVDYVHAGHRHAPHGDHYDEH